MSNEAKRPKNIIFSDLSGETCENVDMAAIFGHVTPYLYSGWST